MSDRAESASRAGQHHPMVVSVNVGMPRDVGWRGRTVRTGAWKSPVTGTTMVRRTNLDGDGQGDLDGHGGEIRAVLVYQLDSYRHWARELSRDDLEPGAFGENLTVDGLPDDEVCIGDRYRIGGALLEVTQPRVTCYRVGLRLDEPRMAALMVSHGRPGFYCRVIEEGELGAGMAITRVADGPGRVTVAELDALLYLPGHPRDRLADAIQIPALSPGWKGSLQSLLEQDGDHAGNSGLTGVAAKPPAWQGFRKLRVTDKRRETPSITSLVLSATDGAPLPAHLAGQSIGLRVTVADAMPTVRNYSLSNAPGTPSYRISVKREADGVVSALLHDRVAVGDEVDVAAPRGSFTLETVTGPIVLVSAGVGVTPVLSMLHRLAQKAIQHPVWWIHAARTEDEHPFADEVSALLAQLPDARSHVFYSRPSRGSTPARVDGERLRRMHLPADATAYLCGPASFMADVRAALLTEGLSDNSIHNEVFGAMNAINPGVVASNAVAPHPPAGEPGPGPIVQFARSGVSAPWNPVHASLLDFAEACDVPTRWACRTGVCHTCETAVLAGEVVYADGPLEAPAAGNALLCIAQPAEAIVLDL